MNIEKYKIEDGEVLYIPGEIKGYNFNSVIHEWVKFDSLHLYTFNYIRYPYATSIFGGMLYVEDIFNELSINGKKIMVYRMFKPWIDAYLFITNNDSFLKRIIDYNEIT